MTERTVGDQLELAVEAAQRWAMFDPSPVHRSAIDLMVDDRDLRLIDLFSGRIRFGTAGLRAAVGPGPQHMNELVVRQTTAAVVQWLHTHRSIWEPRVLIGFDARRDSAEFAMHAAAAVQAVGGVALLADAHTATPVVAHAVLEENADAAVVITASHNPAADNGFKLYLGDGLQLVSPDDAAIASDINRIASDWRTWGPIVDDAYAERELWQRSSASAWTQGHRAAAVAALLTSARTLSVTYSPMHGVGGLAVVAAFREAGFADPLIVNEQFDPDPDFPTVAFPNPEEPGAFDAAVALAVEEGADAALANDPDADRLAVAVPARNGDGFVPLSGNELGVLLADHVLSNTTGAGRVVARSVVSSRQLDAMAASAGVACRVTLTGFKWVARPIVAEPTLQYVFGYEEAIGYCIGDRVRDKDGITAALVAAEMLAEMKELGITVWQRLDRLAEAHGVHANHPISIRFDENPTQVNVLMEKIRSDPPTKISGSAVVASGPIGLGELPPSDGLHLLTADDTQVLIRPSGTEPKLKVYIEVVERQPDLAQAKATASKRLAGVVADVTTLLR